MLNPPPPSHLFQVKTIDYSGDVVRVTCSNGSQWTANKVKPSEKNLFVEWRALTWFLFLLGSGHSAADVAAKEFYPVHPVAS